MKILSFLTICMILCLAVMAWAGKSELAKDGLKTKINGFAPDPSKEVVLTGKSQTIDMTDDVAWGLSPASDCSYRNHSTATKTGNLKTIAAGTDRVRVVNSKGIFATYTGAGCANAILERQ